MKFDVIVVGSGTAGSVVATRLSEDASRKVALIEAGSDYPYFRDLPEAVKYLGPYFRDVAEAARYLGSLESGATGQQLRSAERESVDWGFHARATAVRPDLKIPRGRVIGGTGSINGYAFLRGEKLDFDAWAAAGNEEWSYDKVLPFYKKLENDYDYHDDYHGTSGPMRAARVLRHNWLASDHAFEDACLGLGFSTSDDLNAPGATGVGPTPASSQDGTRYSSARAYLPMARGRSNLKIIPDTLAHRVVFAGSKVKGVQTVAGEVIEGPEVIVSGGSLKSPQILMLSGIGPADQLNELHIPVVADVPGVGRNLRDHPTVVMLWRQRTPPDMPPRRQQASPSGTAGLRLRLTAPGSDLLDDCTIRSHGSALMEGGDDEKVGLYHMSVGLALETSAGEVRTVSDDPNKLPAVDLRYLSTDSDRERMRYVVRLTRDLANQPGLREFLGEMVEPTPADFTDDKALDTWMMRRVKTSHHLSSTCKMGPGSDKMAVVDQAGRVRGVEGLRVADASIMPDCTRPNINITAVMIGERIADYVKEQGR